MLICNGGQPKKNLPLLSRHTQHTVVPMLCPEIFSYFVLVQLSMWSIYCGFSYFWSRARKFWFLYMIHTECNYACYSVFLCHVIIYLPVFKATMNKNNHYCFCFLTGEGLCINPKINTRHMLKYVRDLKTPAVPPAKKYFVYQPSRLSFSLVLFPYVIWGVISN